MDDITLSRDTVQRLHSRLDSQDTLLKDILVAIKGDEAMGHRGLVARVSENETEVQKRAYKSEVTAMAKKVDGHDRKLWLGGIVIAVLAWALPMIFGKK